MEFGQEGQARASYGQRLLPQLGLALSREFGRGFDATNLRHMRGFYLTFPKCDALRRELSWTHYRLVLPSEEELRREIEREQAEIDARRGLENGG